MQEMEWHLFSVLLFSLASPWRSCWTRGMCGSIFSMIAFRSGQRRLSISSAPYFFLLPLALLIFFGSLDFVSDAYEINEISEDPGGLPYRWMIKGMIPGSFALLIFSAFGYTVKNINLYRNHKTGARKTAVSGREAG